ncbi:hypothetical protein C5Y96_06395 [Blastopirellula marina]|uniref:Serine protease n=1 Tax=Blastopirellula marina TaxID=124 RepID=A0A2S8FXB0_9BACT|nr:MULTISPECIES: serine protease [Pirellulaceae]PQO36793.1 hypothetical protein C5Y96_06395 [Blastopirellula marina]RCS53508.1 hypothetical protein DTL36_06405 [Bremerella cremea]
MVGCRVRIVWAVLLGCFCLNDLRADETPIERWDRAVCLVEKHIDKESKQVKHEWSTAFLVSDDKQVLLVGTAHGAQATSRETTVMFRRPDGGTGEVILADLFQADGNPWRTQANSDMAVIRIEPGREPREEIRELMKLAIPLESIQTTLPRRTTPIELTGFPLGLGVKGFRAQPELSSIVICGQIASREMPFPAKWGNETVFIIQLAGAGGISGAPVFLAEESPESVTVVGMVMGYVREDSSGIMMSRIIPGRLVVDAVKASYSRFSP